MLKPLCFGVVLVSLGFLIIQTSQKAPAVPKPTGAQAASLSQSRTLAPSTQAQSTHRMAERLVQITETMNFSQLGWVANHQRVALLQKALAAVTDWKDQGVAELKLANELLDDGQNAECLEHLDTLEQLIAEHHAVIGVQDHRMIRMIRVQAWLRIGESDNCCANHNPDSCLLPLHGAAIYRRQEGPRHAIVLLNEQLAELPGDLTARWLLNLSYMTLGEYPAGVPRQWLIDPKAFASDYDIKRFPEVAAGAGLDTYGLSGSCIVDDFDGDGLLDVVRSDIGFDGQLRFFHNNGDGTFTDRTKEAGLLGEVGGLNIISADFNNDGNLDILVLRGGWFGKAARFPMSLLRNNGDGTFTDVTEQSGLLTLQTAHPTQTAVWFDYDGDGWLDLFVGNESTPDGGVHPCQLFHNNRDGTFTECAAECGVDVIGFIKGVASADYNNDGRPDLYLSQRGGKSNMLLRNDGPRDPAHPEAGWRFTNVTEAAGLAKPISSFPCWFFDYDNDGWPDIFVCGYSGGIEAYAADLLGLPCKFERPRLYHNNHDGTFTDVAAEVGLDKPLLGMAGNFGDLDNDGFLDFYIGTGDPNYTTLMPERMFRNDAGKRFQDVTTSGGFGNLQKGHGIAFADFNNDGQEDVYEVLGGAYSGDKYYSVLYANPGHDNHWITLKLQGVRSNSSAIGARIKIVVETPSGERTLYRTVSTGGSFGCSPLRKEIGLGDAESIKRIQVSWPATGHTQTIAGVPMDRFYTFKEGEAAAVPWKVPTFQFKGMRDAGQGSLPR